MIKILFHQGISLFLRVKQEYNDKTKGEYDMIYPKDIPYMKTLRKTISLPIGTPTGKGNLIFLFSNSVKDSISMINEPTTFSNKGRYYFYFLNAVYRGKIGLKPYKYKNLQERLTIYKQVEDETNLRAYRMGIVIKPGEKRNTYFDLFQYLNLFRVCTDKLNAKRKIELFWSYMKPILTENYGELKNKYVLINAQHFGVFNKGTLLDKIRNPLFLIYYTLWKRRELISDLDIDFLFYCNGKVMKFNPSKTDEKSRPIFLAELKKLYSNYDLSSLEKDDASELVEDDSKPVSKEDEKVQKIVDNLSQGSENQYNFTGPSPLKIAAIAKTTSNEETVKKYVNKVADEKKNIEKEMKDSGIEASEEEITKKAEEKVDKDQEMISDIYNDMMKDREPVRSDRNTARDNLLKEKQDEIVVKGTTIGKLEEVAAEDVKIEETDISNQLKTTNPNMKKIKFNNFNKTYIDNVMSKDIVNCFKDLNDKSIRLFLRDIKVEDTSDELNYKETWTIYLEDENRQRHTIKVDIPKWLEYKFLYIGGNKKIIKNQNVFLPIVKISPDTVLIVSNTNKTTITRRDTKSLRGISILDKLLVKSPEFASFFTIGNSFFDNHKYLTTLEYDDLSKRFSKFQMKNIKMYFNQKEALEIASKKQIKIKKTEIFVGFIGTKPIILDMDTQRTSDNLGIVDIIFDNLDDKFKEILKTINTPKRLMYTNMTTMKQDIPMMIILCLWEGLSKVLRKAKIKFRLANTKRDMNVNEECIKFKNCYLIYDNSVPNELLMNGLRALQTNKFDISAFDTKEAYLDFIQKKFGSLTALNMIMNSYEFTIGSIEREILRDMHCPTDLVSLCIYANNLLCDNDFTSELDQSINRVRCAEIIPGILYDKISKAYTTFKNSNGKKKLSIPQDAVIKELLSLKTVSDYDSLNPFLELEETHGISSKGFRGINLKEAWGVPKRCYDKSMTGIIAPTSSPDANCGVNRSLSMEPNIKSVRGYCDIKDDKLDEVKDVNLFSPAELLIPMGVMHDDSTRTGHSVKQSRHVVPIKTAAPVLISNGSDEMCKYYLSSDFIVNAKQDGVVVEKDEKTKLMIVEYKDGTHEAINLDKNIVKNGGGGFELSNRLVTDLEVGSRFKANDTLAHHEKFFSNSQVQGTRLNIGPLTKIAICGTYNTYEDCTFVTQKLSRECTTEMCFKTPVVIGKNATISQMVKEGDTVGAGDSLIQFDESFDEANINQLLDSLGDDENLKDTVISSSKNTIKSKYSGTIESIKMYSSVELEELSPSLQQIFGKYYQKINAKKKLLEKYDNSGSVVKCGYLLNEPTGKVEPNRYGVIRGEKVVDSVLFEFEIKHEEPLEVGSKIANFTALKNVVGEVIDEGMEPYSEFRKDEEIGTFIPPISILARMTPSIFLNAFGNKCIIELKRALEDIWKGGLAFASKRKAMESLIYGFFSTIDKTGSNTKTYQDLFKPMSDAKFTSFFKRHFSDDMEYLVLNIVDYERNVTMKDIEAAARFLKIPLYEHVYIPHVTGDKEHPIVTKEKVPVGYINIKRTQQTVAKKNGLSINIDKRSAITGQVVRSDKNGRESDLENIMLTSLGMNACLKELNGPRADDMVMKQQMMQDINTKGYTRLSDLDDRIENKTTLNTVDTYFLGMSLKTDLVTRGLKTVSALKNDE